LIDTQFIAQKCRTGVTCRLHTAALVMKTRGGGGG